jgi:glycosyltransferase involved in cell wall biosynthesis
MDLSVVIPLYNERDNLGPLHRELGETLSALGRSYELLFVDDGSTDGSLEELRRLKAGDPQVRVIRLARNSGQTAALACGFQHTTGDYVVAIDGDGENDPADIPRLLAKLDDGYDLASGWRVARWRDSPLRRRWPSVVANRMISRLTGVQLHDQGLPRRPRAPTDALRRDASLRARDRR